MTFRKNIFKNHCHKIKRPGVAEILLYSFSKCKYLILFFIGLSMISVLSAQENKDNVEVIFGPKGIFTYPLPYSDSTGNHSGLFFTSIKASTTDIPSFTWLKGVVLLIPWSLLNPFENKYDFSAIDEVLDYSQSVGRKVILGVYPIGYPLQLGLDLGGTKIFPTPRWALDSSQVYFADTPYAGIDFSYHKKSSFPIMWESPMKDFFLKFIEALGKRYNQDSRVSVIRIITGVHGEDTPALNRGNDIAPGYTHEKWLAYNIEIIDNYSRAFPDKALEIGLSWVGWIYSGYFSSTEREKKAVEDLLQHLIELKVIVGHHGMRSASRKMFNSKSEKTKIWNLIKLAEIKGGQIYLEMFGPPQDRKMLNVDEIDYMIETLRPYRLVLFGAHTLLLEGPNNTNSARVEKFIADKLSKVTDTNRKKWLDLIERYNKKITLY